MSVDFQYFKDCAAELVKSAKGLRCTTEDCLRCEYVVKSYLLVANFYGHEIEGSLIWFNTYNHFLESTPAELIKTEKGAQAVYAYVGRITYN